MKRFPLAPSSMADKFLSQAKKWMSENLTAHIMWNNARPTAASAVAEYIANQQGYTLYENCSLEDKEKSSERPRNS